jgi:hypothetical protein
MVDTLCFDHVIVNLDHKDPALVWQTTLTFTQWPRHLWCAPSEREGMQQNSTYRLPLYLAIYEGIRKPPLLLNISRDCAVRSLKPAAVHFLHILELGTAACLLAVWAPTCRVSSEPSYLSVVKVSRIPFHAPQKLTLQMLSPSQTKLYAWHEPAVRSPLG